VRCNDVAWSVSTGLFFYPTGSAAGGEFAGGAPVGSEPLRVDRKAMNVRGWFLPEPTKRSGMPAMVRVTNATGRIGWQAPLDHRFPRPDVNSKMGALDGGDAGFATRLELGALDPGTYRVTVAFNHAGRDYVCERGPVLLVQ
jgi:hypothetical protein